MEVEETHAPSLWLDVAGRAVPVWVHLPAQLSRVVVTSHGLTNDHRDAPLFSDLRRRLLADGGWAIVEFDYPGSGLADGEFTDKRFALLRSALEEVVSKARTEIAPGSPLAIVARSLGASIALSTAPVTRPERMVVMSPPFELTRNIASLRGEPNAAGNFPLPPWAPPSGQVKGVPALAPEFFDELDDEARRIRRSVERITNTLLVSSTEDPKVEAAEMQRLWEAIEAGDGNRHMVVGSDHNYETVADSVTDAIESWIGK